MCKRNTRRAELMLRLLEADLPIAKKLKKDSADQCTTPPALLECGMPDGTIVFTYADEASRKTVADMSATGEKFISLNLLRSVYGHKSLKSDSSLLEFHEQHLSKVDAADVASYRALNLASNTDSDASTGFPVAKLCKPAKKPTCAEYKDLMGTFVGNVQDSIDELKNRQGLHDSDCRKREEINENTIKENTQAVDELNVRLANAAAEQAELKGEVDAAKKTYGELAK